jgi:hypothetical protein
MPGPSRCTISPGGWLRVGVRFDASGWPLVEVSWEGQLADADVAAFTRQMDEWFSRGSPFGLLILSRGGLGMTGDQRRLLLAHMQATAHLAERHLVLAFVADSAIQRALYAALSWAIPMSFPGMSFDEAEPARAWLTGQLAARARKAAGTR